MLMQENQFLEKRTWIFDFKRFKEKGGLKRTKILLLKLLKL